MTSPESNILKMECVRFLGSDLASVMRFAAEWVEQNKGYPIYNLVTEFSPGLRDDDDNLWYIFIYIPSRTNKEKL
jgi:hypothetical protein